MDGGSTDNSPEISRRYADQLTGWRSRADGGRHVGARAAEKVRALYCTALRPIEEDGRRRGAAGLRCDGSCFVRLRLGDHLLVGRFLVGQLQAVGGPGLLDGV